MFSVPGVRKLALQSAVPMANVVTRPRGSLTEENFLPDLTGTVSVFKIPNYTYLTLPGLLVVLNNYYSACRRRGGVLNRPVSVFFFLFF